MLFRSPQDSTGLTYASEEELRKPQLLEVKAIALSCVLIHRTVLEKVKFHWAGESFDDMQFSKDAISAGFKIYVDTTVKPNHLHCSWDGIQK